MKVYHGQLATNLRGGRVVTVTSDAGVLLYQLAPRNDLQNHSPDGFSWGYGGSGPAQLALALAADVLDNDADALGVYQDLKWAVVAKWPMEQGWDVTEHELFTAIRAIEAAHLHGRSGHHAP